MGKFDVVVAPQLSQYSATTWYLVDASDAYDRALIYQVRDEPELVALFNPEDPEVFMREYFEPDLLGRLLHGGEARHHAVEVGHAVVPAAEAATLRAPGLT